MTVRLAFVFVLLLGACLRFVFLGVPPLDFHATRQYRSALIARADSPVAMAALTPPQAAAATKMGQAQIATEPEVMEAIAVGAYAVLGREDLRAPRAVAALAWLMAGLAIAWMTRTAGLSGWLSVLALAVTLGTPYGIDASRAFMPDPLMTGLTMLALAFALRHHRHPQTAWAVARVVAAAAAIYVKPMAGFVIAPAFLALDVARLGMARGLVVATGTAAVAAAPAAWHYVMLMQAGNPVAENRFFAQLWLRPSYWTGWFAMLQRVIGVPALVLSVVGLVAGRGPLRTALVGAWAGYAALGLFFTHHISTHDYYSLPVIPLAGASVALAVHALGLRLVAQQRQYLPIAIAGVLVLSWAVSGATRPIYGEMAQARQTARDYERIGELTSHDAQVVSLDGSYGYPLSYHARIGVSQLPLSIDRAISDLTGRADTEIVQDVLRRGGAYFVGTVQPELDAQPTLRQWLLERRRLVDRGGPPERWRYVVYDLREPPGAPVIPTPIPGDISPPFGFLDAPAAGVPISLADTTVLLQGWALDDRGLDRVEVLVERNGQTTVLGHAARGGRREDVAAIHPTAPDINQSGFAFTLWPMDRALAPATLHVRVVDTHGNVIPIGSRELR